MLRNGRPMLVGEEEFLMAGDDENGVTQRGAEGAQIKRRINDAKNDRKTEPFDPGASMLGTDNEAGTTPDHEGMAEARKAPKP